jgi:hypothetical protein
MREAIWRSEEVASLVLSWGIQVPQALQYVRETLFLGT